MNITLTRKEFTRLIELAYIGDWVATAMDGGDDTDAPAVYEKRYGGLMQKLYRLAATGEDGCPQYVETAKDGSDELFPAMRLEDDSPASRAIDKFTNDTFWEELIARMSERDLARETRSDTISPAMPPDALDEQADRRLDQLEDRYRDEFVRNDLENIIVLFGADRLS